MQLPPTGPAVPADTLARTTTPAPAPILQEPPPSCTRRISAGAQVMLMPELAHAIQHFLTPQHLATAASICQAWRRIWTPILWRHLSFLRPRTTTPLDHEYYFLSSECLLRHGHHARTLRASRLTTTELLRLCQHCPHLNTIVLQGTDFSLKFLRHLLGAAPGLTRLVLDWDWNTGYGVDHENRAGTTGTGAGTGTNTDADTEDSQDTDTDAHVERGSEIHNVIKTIDRWASPHLEYLVLIPHPSIKVLERDLRSLFRTRTCLRTVKLHDVDVQEDIVPRQKGRSKKKENKQRRETIKEQQQDSALATTLQTLEGSLGSRKMTISSSSSSPCPSVGRSSLSEAESVSSLEQQQQPVEDIVSLEFLSINSSASTTLANLLHGCTQLRVLHLHRCDYLKDAALEAIAQHAPSIMSIALTHCRQLTTTGLGSFLKTKTRTRPLEHVHFQDLPALNDEVLGILATHHGQSIRKLAIYYSYQVTNRGLQAVLSVATGLKILSIQSYRMTLAVFSNPWACYPTLESLELYGQFNRPKEYCHGATSLNSPPPLPKPDPFAKLKSRIMTLSHLKELRLSATGIGKDLLEGFGHDLRIESLGLYDMGTVETFSLEWATVKTGFPHLKQLYCVFGCQQGHFCELLAPLQVEVYPSYKIPKLASDFDDEQKSSLCLDNKH